MTMNRINISYRDCLQIECESSELTFDKLKAETLELIQIVRKHLVDSEEEPNNNDVV